MNLDKLLDAAAHVFPRWTARLLGWTPRQRAVFIIVASVMGGFLGLWIAVGGAAWAVQGVLSAALEYAQLPMHRARIEYLRSVAKTLPVCDTRIVAYTPVIADIQSWNMRLTHEYQANRLWYSDVFSPDGWTTIPLIQLPECNQ